MSDVLSKLLADATVSLESEPILTPAIDAIAQMADIEVGRITLESCIEKILMADGSVVDVLTAEQEYKDWRADHPDLKVGTAQTGEPVLREMQAALEMLNSPSMEAGIFRDFKSTFNKLSLMTKTFGKNLNGIRNKINNSKSGLTENPVIVSNPAVYNFFTRANKAVKIGGGSVDTDIEFLNKCEAHYTDLFNRTTELSKRFREACQQDSSDAIRDTIDYLESEIPTRNELADLTKFHLSGNRAITLDSSGFPKFVKNPSPWDLKKEGGILGLVARKKLHSFSIGGVPKIAPKIEGLNPNVAKRQLQDSVKSSGGAVDPSNFIKLLDKVNLLNSKTIRFSSMANTMAERVQRLTADMDNAYNHVNSEKSQSENYTRVQELRALRVSARKSVATYMFMAKSLATIMEDHTSYLYRNVTILANDVLNKTGK